MESLPEISTQPTSLTAVKRSPRPAQSTLHRSVECVRVARSEWTSREQLINSLRSENLGLAARLRAAEGEGHSHTQLLEACGVLAQTLNCSIEGVACETVGSILQGRVGGLVQESRQARESVQVVRGELERAKGELAAAAVKCSSLQEALNQSQASLDTRNNELRQLKDEGEELKQSCARLGATVCSLRGQLNEAQSSSSPSLCDQLTHSQTQLGRAKKELASKSSQLDELNSRLSQSESDAETARERASSAERMYSELWAQLVAALRLEPEDPIDSDSLTAKVSALVEDSEELQLRMDTVNKSMRSVELDAKANRETIMRLVSEARQHEGHAVKIDNLEKEKLELCEKIQTSSKEKEGLEERLGAARETLLAQEKELQCRNERVETLSQRLVALQTSSESTRSLASAAEERLGQFCESLQGVVGAESAEPSTLISSVQQLVKDVAGREEESSEQSARVSELEGLVSGLETRLARCGEELETRTHRLGQLEEDRSIDSLAAQSLTKDLNKHKTFTNNLIRALNIDTATAEIISGDFAQDAILTRAEQLAKQETQALAEKQTAVYTLQRRLKSCRQSLDNKEVHLGLVQKRLTLLEERMLDYASREQDWSASADKMRKMEKALERLQTRAAQQKEAINLLKDENSQVQNLKSQKSRLEERVEQLTGSLEEVSQARVHQAQLLAEARVKQSRPAVEPVREREEVERLQGELESVKQQLVDSRTREAELERLKKAMVALLSENNGEAPDNYRLIASLEKVLATQQKSKETIKCLEASLKQLESGFKSSYNEALTLLTLD